MRILFAAVAALLVAAVPPPSAKDWRAVTGTTPAGAFTAGNPAARVKLVEYLSFTCPHCGHFVAESKAPLFDTMVRNGSVQVEWRAAARDAYDLAAWTLARCAGARRFHPLSVAIFAQQEAWITRGQAYAQANMDTLKALPQLAQLRTLAQQSGLSDIAVKQGMTPAQVTQCFASDAAMKPAIAMTEATFKKISGTPGFEVNGRLAENTYDWATLEPKLRAAGAR